MDEGPLTEKVKVVVMLDTLRMPGGGERLAVEGAIRLDPERFERTFCLTRWEDRFEEEEPARSLLARLRESDVRVLGLRRSHRLELWAWAPLVRMLRRERVDVLHAHLFGSNVWAAVFGTVAGVPAIVAHEHMWAYSGRRARPFLDRHLIARLSDAFIAVSREGRRRMIEVERIDPDDIVLIPNGARSLPPGDGASLRSELGIPPDAPLVGSVGHLRPEKAFEVLIAAAGRLRERLPELHVVIAGEGRQRAMLEELRAQLGVEGRVHLPGARADVPDLLASLDLAVCCSDFEGGPLSVMEYMDAGLPVVATRVGGLPELVEDGVSGVLVPPRDPGALAEAIANLLADPERATTLAKAGQELRRREYDIDVWIKRLERLYGLLLERRRVRA